MTKAEGGQHIGAWQPFLRRDCDMATASCLAPTANARLVRVSPTTTRIDW